MNSEPGKQVHLNISCELWLHVFVTSILPRCHNQISLTTQIPWPFPDFVPFPRPLQNSLTFPGCLKFRKSGNPVFSGTVISEPGAEERMTKCCWCRSECYRQQQTIRRHNNTFTCVSQASREHYQTSVEQRRSCRHVDVLLPDQHSPISAPETQQHHTCFTYDLSNFTVSSFIHDITSLYSAAAVLINYFF